MVSKNIVLFHKLAVVQNVHVTDVTVRVKTRISVDVQSGMQIHRPVTALN